LSHGALQPLFGGCLERPQGQSSQGKAKCRLRSKQTGLAVPSQPVCRRGAWLLEKSHPNLLQKQEIRSGSGCCRSVSGTLAHEGDGIKGLTVEQIPRCAHALDHLEAALHDLAFHAVALFAHVPPMEFHCRRRELLRKHCDALGQIAAFLLVSHAVSLSV